MNQTTPHPRGAKAPGVQQTRETSFRASALLTSAEITAIRAAVEALGEVETRRRLDLPRPTFARLYADLPVRAGTIALARANISRLGLAR